MPLLEGDGPKKRFVLIRRERPLGRLLSEFEFVRPDYRWGPEQAMAIAAWGYILYIAWRFRADILAALPWN